MQSNNKSQIRVAEESKTDRRICYWRNFQSRYLRVFLNLVRAGLKECGGSLCSKTKLSWLLRLKKNDNEVVRKT